MRTLSLLALLACAEQPSGPVDDDVPGESDASADTDDTDGDTDGDTDAVGGTRFTFPVAPRTAIDSLIGVDHDPATGDGVVARVTCTNYAGEHFPKCYDEHDGSDFVLSGGFPAMDAGSATVLAGAAGEVTAVVDEHYDRCHADLASGDVSCDTDPDTGKPRPIVPNKIELLHRDGVRTRYLHLMKGSALVQVGDVVERGQPLATIGSSGRSSFPHLHFEVEGPDGETIDPYAGPESQPTSWWCEQEHGDGFPGPCP